VTSAVLPLRSKLIPALPYPCHSAAQASLSMVRLANAPVKR
jgi:hypothetical protein